VLHEVAKVLQDGRDRRRMLSSVLALVRKVLQADRGYVVQLDEGGQLVPLATQTPIGDIPPERADVHISKTVVDHLIRDRCGIIITDALLDERLSPLDSVARNGTRSLLAVPMVVDSQVIGLLQVETVAAITAFTEKDLDLLTIVASMVGSALENARLAQQRERTIADLQAAQRTLLKTQEKLIRSEQMAAIGSLASGIAHEVKNHLAPLMLAEMLRRDYPNVPGLQEAAELMMEAQDRIVDLVNEVSRFAKGATAESVMGLEDLSALAGSVIRFLLCDSRVRSIGLELLAPSPVLAECDAHRIRQVLINLIRNATDAVDPLSGHIFVIVKSIESTAVIEVYNNGADIPTEVASRMFEPFFTTKGEHGLGLGLDISRSIVLSHSGELSYRRAPAGGTIFRITLPLKQPPPAAPDPVGGL
jgi:signal transduction histidine kinase